MPLRLHLFGPLRAFADEAPLKFPPRSKVGALFAYLILQREHPLSRALAASVFWPDESEDAARAAAPNGIKVVALFYRFSTGSSSSEFQSVAMNPIGGDLYQRTLNPTSLLGGSIPFDQATLQYQVVVQQNDGDISIRTPVLADIAMQACGSVTAACSSYTDRRAREAHGCNWVEIPGAVPIYECRNP